MGSNGQLTGAPSAQLAVDEAAIAQHEAELRAGLEPRPLSDLLHRPPET